MNGKLMFHIDQYGYHIWSKTIKDLRAQCGGGRVFLIYRDDPLTKEVHRIGTGVGERWFTSFYPLRIKC